MIQKDTLAFIKALQENNYREWFNENKDWYERARADFEKLVAQVIQIIASFDPEIGLLEPKQCIFRIYRDVRFSPDKSPYKTHFGAAFRPRSLNKTSGYYLHVAPEGSFVSCGHYMLDSAQLKKVRKGIYSDFDTLYEIINNKDFKNEIGDLGREDDTLTRVPNGFDKDHPAAEYLKLKHFYAAKEIPMEILTSEEILPYLNRIYRIMHPLNEYLNDLLLGD
ncbi:MAG: DUF2461 domain-containing protein [Dysgonomonas sp.]|nr:DUF2461 domain-containing protein [Dysgonomonas sp.]